MFQTVRHWWTGGRGKVTARLFLFEFAVVVIGILIAQAGWVQDRAAISNMEKERASLLKEVSFRAAVAEGWRRAIPCIDDRMRDIMISLAEGRQLSPKQLDRPGLYTIGGPSLNESIMILLAERYGETDAVTFRYNDEQVRKLDDKILKMTDDWKGLALANPANGPVAAGDRLEARKSAAGIRAALRGMLIDTENIIGDAQALGVSPSTRPDFRLIRNCADLWQTDRTHPDPRTDDL